jgi:hypothetical protein
VLANDRPSAELRFFDGPPRSNEEVKTGKKLIDEFRRSGQSQREFAEAREIKPGTPSWWSWKLGAEGGKAARPASGEEQRSSSYP